MSESHKPAKRSGRLGVQPLGTVSTTGKSGRGKGIAPPAPEHPVIVHVPAGARPDGDAPAKGSLTIVAPAAMPEDSGARAVGNGNAFVQYVTPREETPGQAADQPAEDGQQQNDEGAEVEATGPLGEMADGAVSADESKAPASAPDAPPPPPGPAAPGARYLANVAMPAEAAASHASFSSSRTTTSPAHGNLSHLDARAGGTGHTPTPPHPAAPGQKSSHPGPQAPTQPLMFEIAWEVCWQLGGIYTVIRSKAPQMARIYGDHYYLIGPYNADTAAVEIEYAQPTGSVAVAIERLRSLGIIVHYGHWLITGRPRVILLDFGAAMSRLGEFKYFLWKDHGIQVADNDWEVNNVTAFGFLVGLFFQQLCAVPGVQLPILAHFHEWMGGLGAMRIKCLNLPVATVFTTHATLLGRYLCTDNPDFYAKLPYINPDHAAGHYNIYARYCIERGAAHSADVFTTVSDVTGLEAEKLLVRKPDVITPNGLNIHKFAALHEFQNMHKQYKEVIHQFVAGHFFPSYHFDLDRTIYVFTSGRYEYSNKGMDVFIESLARLNHWLKAGNIPITVVAFIITRAPHKNINVDVLRSQAMFDELKATCDFITEDMGKSLLNCVSQGRLPERGDLMREEAIVKLKRTMHAWRTWKQPGIVTHDLWDDANDPVLRQLRICQLFNARHDAVKIIFHPDFLSATSPLIGLDYDQFVRGCHMGVFPSYYEPWGYTPAECLASGVPSVTSDLAGFGSYVLKNVQDPQSKGLFIVGRRYASFDQSAHQLTEILFNFALKDRRSRIELRNRTERLSEVFDWSHLISHYTEAHRLALARKIGAAV